MTYRDFINWLHGYTEDKDSLNSDELNRVRERMNEISESVGSDPIVPLHPIITPIPGSGEPYSPPYWVGDFPPYGGTTINYSYTSSDKITDQDEVDKKSGRED